MRCLPDLHEQVGEVSETLSPGRGRELTASSPAGTRGLRTAGRRATSGKHDRHLFQFWEAAHRILTVGSHSYIASIMPYDTPIPNWAFTDPLATGGTFNATAARAAADNLFGTSTSSMLAIIVRSSSADSIAIPDTVFNVKSEATTTPSPAVASTSGCSTNTGAIAGGTVGGFTGGALLGALAAFLAARKKARKTKAAGDDGQHSVHSQDTQDTIMREKARINGLA